MKRENVDLARGLRYRMTDAERSLWRHLRGRHFESWKFRRQHQLSGYIVDFVCLAAGLVVELDGGQHLQDAKKDAVRTKALNALGYRVIRFWNDDVLIRTDVVLEEILAALEQATLTPALSPLGRGRQARHVLRNSNEHAR